MTLHITISDYYKGLCVVAQLFESVCPKMAHFYISVYNREKYPNLYTKTELKAMKLMPSPNAKHRAVVVRPQD